MVSSRILCLLALTALAGCGGQVLGSTGNSPRDGGGGATAGDADSSAGASSVAGTGGASGASSADASDAGGSSSSDASDAGGSSGSDASDAGGSSGSDASDAGGSSPDASDAGGVGGAGGAGGTPSCTSSDAVTWSHAYGVDMSFDTVTHLASDSNDGTLTSGVFHGTLDLGGATYTTASNPYCNNVPPTDGFLLKLDASGGYAWSGDFSCGTHGSASIADATLDPAGDALAVGSFTQSITIGGVTYTNAPPPCMGTTSPGGEGGFLVKRSGASGAGVWSRGLTTPDGSVWPAFVAADPAGNVLVYGDYDGTLDAGGGAFTCNGFANKFIAKYAGADGAPLWSRCFATNYSPTYPVVTDANGDVVISAAVNGPEDFGAGPVSTGNALVIARYDGATGALEWTKIVATGEAVAYVLRRVGPDLYAAGLIANGADFGTGPYTNDGHGDVFVARFKIADGSLVWVRMFGGYYYDSYADSLTTDGCGLLVGGEFDDNIDFGFGPMVTSAGGGRFLVHLTTDGDTISATNLGIAGSGALRGYGLAPASDGGAFISGWTSQSIDLYGTTIAANTNMQKLFVARLAP